MQQRKTWAGVCTALALALAVAVPVFAADEHFDRTLSVSGPVTLTVSTGSGDVVVKTGDERSVRVVGTVRPNTGWSGYSSTDAEAAARNVAANPPIVQEGNAIRLGEFTDKELGRKVSISFEVTVPKATSATARSGSGDIALPDLGGTATVQTGSGDIRVGRAAGAVKAQSGSGDIVIAGARERVDVSTGSGDVQIDDVAGAATVRTGSGDVTVTQSAGGGLDLNSGSGSLTARGLTGPVNARSASGTVRLAGKPTSDWEVSTASGGIEVEIPEGTAFRVSARSSSGGISIEHTTSNTTTSRRELDATVGQGGPLLSLRSASGGVAIRKAAGK